MNKKIEYVVAMDLNKTIGNNGELPWKLPIDLKRFKNITINKTIVMGRKTYESIGKPLPDRKTIVMTKDPLWKGNNWNEDCINAQTIEDAKQKSLEDTLFIVGGSEIYKLFMLEVTQIHATIVQAFIEGDTKFPEIHKKYEKEILEYNKKDDRNTYDTSFEIWKF